MTTKNPKPLTQPRPGEPNYGKFCAQPGSLPTTDLPMQPSLKEQMQQTEIVDSPATMATPPAVAFDPKACILCDHVIVQKILGNKCKISGALCCNLKSCPIEDLRRGEARAPAPVAKKEVPCCENCLTIKCFHHPNHWKTASQCWSRNDHIQVWEFTKEHGAACHPGARAYLNKDVIKTLESWRNGLDYPDCPPGDTYARVIALLRGEDK